MSNKFKNFLFDVDGVFTDGCFYYSDEGKVLKKFGDADNDALSFLKNRLHVEMLTGDKRGFSISKKRIQIDMGYKINLVSTFQRVEWIKERFNLNETIYMGDGIYDSLVFKEVGYAIAPNNAFYLTKEHANFVTNSKGSEGAVAEAIIHVIQKFIDPKFNIFDIDFSSGSGNWK